MSRLTTVAAFDLAAKAQIARNVLEAAGIPAVVTDQEIVAMDWLLANSVGGIKVQVNGEDAERAAAVLQEKLGAQSGLVSEGLDEDELTRQALEAEPEEPEPAEEPPPPEPAAEAEPEPPPDRDAEAWRAFVFAWLGFLLPPLAIYGLYLWLVAAFGSGVLTRTGRVRLLSAALVLVLPLVIDVALLGAFLFGVMDR